MGLTTDKTTESGNPAAYRHCRALP